MSDEPEWTMEIPPEWKTAGWSVEHCRPMLEVPAAKAMAAQAMLRDGTNILALMWPTGQRLLRIGPATGHAMQEHFTGTIPAEHRKVISDVWAKLVACYVEAAAMADDDLRRMGRAPVRKPRTATKGKP